MEETKKQHSDEIALLIACCRKTEPAELAEEIDLLLHTDLDWDYLFRVSYRNAVFSIVFTNLLRAAQDRLPDRVVADATATLRYLTDVNMYLTGETLRIVNFFKKASVPLLPFKGPILSIQAYGDPGLRSYCDLDLLVQPKHLDEATSLLKENGFKPVSTASWLQKSSWYISSQKDVHFVDKTGRTVVELHWKLSGSHFGMPKEMNRLWERLESISVAGVEVPNLSFNDLVIYLCLHGSRHSWERFGWICDVFYLLTSRDHVDFDTVRSESRELGCERVVALGLKLVEEFFDYRVPATFQRDLEDDSIFSDIVVEVRKRIFAPENVQVELGDRYAYHLKLKERRVDRWKLHFHYLTWYLRIILTPNQMDRDVLHLPQYLHPFYYVTRPIRLLYQKFL